ncbi:MAG: ATP-grasp domain-containing protein [Nitrospirota bacterium]|nr:ATP-grasp domain-containing protein [Nitrospirota bacterium]MDH5699188.1 ATP-grasp domain-containing protein [Nitrospirota bacterium]
MSKNIFVVGLDDFNLALLQPIGAKKSYEFHSLLSVQDVKRREHYNPDELLRKAEKKLKSFRGTIDAIVGYWDFPTTCLVPFLNQKFGLPGPSVESVLKCEHKFWSRVEQRQVLTDIPAFCAFNPFEANPRSKVDLPFPFWMKPVKAFASQLGFRIHNEKEFEGGVERVRQKISHFAEPFNYFLDQITLPPSVAGIGGDWCIAEAIIAGRQCTLEGYVYKGEVEIYGVIDSIREPNRSTFARYQYPSQLPKRIQDLMIQAAQTIMTYLRYDNAPFNMEFFYDEPHARIWLLEINPRISQSHCDVFRKVDGASHQEVMIDLALGKRPEFPHRQGEFGCAAKIFLRTHEDAVLKHVPGEKEIQHVKERFSGALVNIHVKEGMRPSDLPNQESYSYELGYVCLGAQNEHELLEHSRTCQEYLKFEYSS